MEIKNILSICFILIFVLTFVSADQNCPAGLPNEYYGNIYVDEGLFDPPTLLIGEYNLIVTIDGVNAGSQFIDDGTYFLDISPCYGTSEGTIEFIVNGVEAEESAEYNSESAISKNLDLILGSSPTADSGCGDEEINAGEECDDGNTLSGDGCSDFCEVEFGYTCKAEPSICSIIHLYCGDGICSGTETCSSCSVDCGICSNPSDDDDGDDSSSSSSGGPSQKDSLNVISNLVDNNEIEILSIDSLNENIDSSDLQTKRKGITGFAVATLGETGSAITGFMVLALGVLGFIFIRKRKLQKIN